MRIAWISVSFASTLSLAPFFAGCSSKAAGGADAGADLAVTRDLAIGPDLAGDTHAQFVLDSVLVPDSSSEDTKYLYDVDGTGTKRNKLDAVVDALKAAGGGSLQGVVDNAVATGQLLQLFDVASSDPALMNDGSLSVAGYVGQLADGQQPADLFSGADAITLDLTEEPAQHTLTGILASGKADTQHLPVGSFPIHFPLQGLPQPVPLTIYAAHVTFQVIPGVASVDGGASGFRLGDGATFRAQINGGLSQAQVHSRLVPAIAMMLQSIVDQDPTGANAMTVLKNFDQNHDGKVSPDEVEAQPIVSAILAPDIDLFDENGNLAPNQDKVQDSLSFGVGFSGVPARFLAPK